MNAALLAATVLAALLPISTAVAILMLLRARPDATLDDAARALGARTRVFRLELPRRRFSNEDDRGGS
jgi:hypothetical protein